MINQNFSQKILKKIQEDNIKPTPKWHFLLKDYIVWFFGFFSLVTGAIAFSVIIYLIKYNDWEIYNQTNGGFWEFFLLTLPYFWLLLLFLFSFLVFYNVKHTKNGYRYSVKSIVLSNILISITLGFVFYHTGIGRRLDDILGEKVSFYPTFINHRMHFWSQPESGRLAGIVVSSDGDKSFVLFDVDNKKWTVIRSDDLGMKVEIEKPVRVLGKILSENAFEANRIFPAGRLGMGFFKKHRENFFQHNNGFSEGDGMFFEQPPIDHSQCPLRDQCLNK